MNKERILQHSDERPPSGRPSLLTQDQQSEADRHRILSGLDNRPGATSAGEAKGRKSMAMWLAAGSAVLAFGTGAGYWLVSEGEKEIVLASVPLPATPAPAAALASDAPVVRGTADDVPADAILQDVPYSVDNVADSNKQEPDELTRLLEQGIPAQPDRSVPPLVMDSGKGAPERAAPVKAQEKRAPKPMRAVAKQPMSKPMSTPVVRAREEASNIAPRPRVSAPGKKKADAKPAAPVDSDVALLAALVAHSKATEPKSGGAAAKLRQCKSLATVADANACRARVCAGANNAPECKSANPPKGAAAG
jgi:hypothetical protein